MRHRGTLPGPRQVPSSGTSPAVIRTLSPANAGDTFRHRISDAIADGDAIEDAGAISGAAADADTITDTTGDADAITDFF